MARKPRLEFPGACNHVINRGNYRRALFGGPGAAESFEKALFEACGDSKNLCIRLVLRPTMPGEGGSGGA